MIALIALLLVSFGINAYASGTTHTHRLIIDPTIEEITNNIGLTIQNKQNLDSAVFTNTSGKLQIIIAIAHGNTNASAGVYVDGKYFGVSSSIALGNAEGVAFVKPNQTWSARFYFHDYISHRVHRITF
jgi:hypothetical protein